MDHPPGQKDLILRYHLTSNSKLRMSSVREAATSDERLLVSAAAFGVLETITTLLQKGISPQVYGVRVERCEWKGGVRKERREVEREGGRRRGKGRGRGRENGREKVLMIRSGQCKRCFFGAVLTCHIVKPSAMREEKKEIVRKRKQQTSFTSLFKCHSFQYNVRFLMLCWRTLGGETSRQRERMGGRKGESEENVLKVHIHIVGHLSIG